MTEHKVAPMTAMSRAIRETIETYAPTLQELPDEIVKDFATIVSAFAGDLKAEMERRWQGES
jgi:hypothetical protein